MDQTFDSKSNSSVEKTQPKPPKKRREEKPPTDPNDLFVIEDYNDTSQIQLNEEEDRPPVPKVPKLPSRIPKKISKKKNIPWDQFDPEQADDRSIIRQLMIEAYKQTQEAKHQENSLTWFHSAKICLQAAALLLKHNENTKPHYTLDDDEVLPRFVVATEYKS